MNDLMPQLNELARFLAVVLGVALFYFRFSQKTEVRLAVLEEQMKKNLHELEMLRDDIKCISDELRDLNLNLSKK